jgi:hypothetical protein
MTCHVHFLFQNLRSVMRRFIHSPKQSLTAIARKGYIHQANAVEFDTSVNSMVECYAKSFICLVYLNIVPARAEPKIWLESGYFRRSQRFRTAWILQAK